MRPSRSAGLLIRQFSVTVSASARRSESSSIRAGRVDCAASWIPERARGPSPQPSPRSAQGGRDPRQREGEGRQGQRPSGSRRASGPVVQLVRPLITM